MLKKSKALAFYLALLVSPLGLSACSDDNPQEFWAEGLKLMEEGNPNGAIVFFRNALDQDSKNFELRHDLVKAYIATGKREQALTELEKCLLQEPGNVDILLTAARFHTNADDAEKALAYLGKIHDFQEPTAETLELAGANYRFLNRVEEAEEAYKEALVLDPKRVASEVNLASLYLAQRRTQEGIALLNKIISENPNNVNALQLRALASEGEKNFDVAELDYKKMISLQPNEITYLYALGELYLKQGKVEEAEKIHAAMVRSFKSNAFENLLGGMIAFQKNEFEKASTLFQQSVNSHPSFSGLYYLASSLHKINNSESALSNLRRILDIQPENVSALMLSAQILFEQGRYREAEYEVKNLIRHNSENATAYNLLGSIQRALGENDAALEAFKQALTLDENNTQATISRSQILLEQNRDVDAIAELEKSMQANPGRIAERVALFDYYMKKNDYTKAYEVLQEALDENPESPLLLSMKASVQMAQKENDLAIETLKKAYSFGPTFMPVIQLLLNIYMLDNDNESALALCDDFLKNNPENADFLVTSATLLDNLGRTEEATERLIKANELNSERALLSLVRRALLADDKVGAEKYLTDKLAAYPVPPVRYLLASFYMDQGDLQKAVGVYNLDEIKNSHESLTSKFRIYSGAKMHKEALEQTEILIQNFAQSPDGYVLKAFALESNDEFDKAFATLENAYLEIRAPQLLIQLANLCLRNDRLDKALSYFRTSLLEDPDNKEALSGQSYTFLKQKKYGEAIAGYEKIMSIYPNDLANQNNLAMALAEEGINTSRAVDLATKIFISAPENETIIDTYAFTLIRNKQVSEALNILENGLKANPESALLNYRKGLALIEDNQINDGVLAIKKAVELGNFSEIENAKKIIEENGG